MGNEAFSVAFLGKLLSIHETVASAKTAELWEFLQSRFSLHPLSRIVQFWK